MHEAVSSGAGEFAFDDLPAGAYTIKIQAVGFQNTEVNSVQVLAGKVYTLPVKLNLAQQAETVQVSADALSLDTTTIAQTTTLSGAALQSTPLNGRDFTQLLGTSSTFPATTTPARVNGLRADQLNYTIDGTDNNDLYLQTDAVNQGGISGIAGVIYPIDALDEYSLQTTGNAESAAARAAISTSRPSPAPTSSWHCLLLQPERGRSPCPHPSRPRLRQHAPAQSKLRRLARRPHLEGPHLPLP